MWPPRLLVFVTLLGGSTAACGAQKEAEDPHVVESAGLPPEGRHAAVLETVDQPLTQLERAAVVRTLDEGFGQFLHEIEVEASMVEGRFQGFRVLRFTDKQRWRGVGLLPGDVVTSVNDQPIERPEQAHAVFMSLKSAPNLEVTYLRGGQPMRLSLPIVGEASAPVQTAPAAPAAPAPPAPPAPPPARPAPGKAKSK